MADSRNGILLRAKEMGERNGELLDSVVINIEEPDKGWPHPQLVHFFHEGVCKLHSAADTAPRLVYEYILNGYRPDGLPIRACIRSLFSLHNETWNVWSHIFGSLVFVYLAFETWQRYVATSSQWIAMDIFMFVLFFFCTILCFCCSSAYHLLNCHSKWICELLLRFDYMGVIMHIGGNMIIGHYYFWQCENTWLRIYLSIIPPLYAAGTILPMFDCFMQAKHRNLRMVLFLLVGVCCVLPVIHWGVISSGQLNVAVFVRAMVRTLSCYFGAMFFYMTHIPERFSPGKFDLFGCSHQIWHMLSFAGALSYYFCITDMHIFRLTIPCP